MPYTSSRSWQSHRPVEHTIDTYGITTGQEKATDDCDLINRIIRAYQKSIVTKAGDPENFWNKLYSPLKQNIHDALARGETQSLSELLRDPSRNYLFYGFDGLHSGAMRDNPSCKLCASNDYDNLLRLCEAVGATRLEQPESYQFDSEPPIPREVEDLLALLDGKLGVRVDFPNPFPNEVGLRSSRGIASYRAIHSIYQAKRLKDLTKRYQRPRVLEIGGGLGRTAYYARKFGILDYTIVDIPMTAVAQAYFLSRSLGPGEVALVGESLSRDTVKILSPPEFFVSNQYYDVVINVDSLPELGQQQAIDCISAIRARSAVFLSINHELLPTLVRDLCPLSQMRMPYWMRRGYVEEIYEFEKMNSVP